MAEHLVTQVHCSEEDDAHMQSSSDVKMTSLVPSDSSPRSSSSSSSCWNWLCCFRKKKHQVQQQQQQQQQGSSDISSIVTQVPNPHDQQQHSHQQASFPASVALTQQPSRPVPQPVNGAANVTNVAPREKYIPLTPPSPLTQFLLPPLAPEHKNRKTLVLDLDETLVHSSFKPIPNPDFVISIELDNVIHRVYVRKRPGVDHFLKTVGEKFEVVIFTASLAKYADPLLDILDRHKVVSTRLFREACVYHYGNYVKDLTHLGRALENSIIVDNSPFSYMFQPDNAIPISSWFNDKNDRQLYDLIPFLESIVYVDDVCTVLQRNKNTFT